MDEIVPNYHDNPAQRTPCMLVLDASGSMGEPVADTGRRRIDELNYGLAALQRELQSDETAAHRVQLAIVCVGGLAGEADLLMDWTDAMDFQAPCLAAGGRTPLAKGMALALQTIDAHKRALRDSSVGYTRPWIIVISDGEPTDEPQQWQAVTRQCREAEAARRCIIYPIAVAEANMQMLQQVSATPVIRLSEARFREYFQWLSSSLRSLSRSRPGKQVQLAATSPWDSVFGDPGPWSTVSA